MQNAKCKIKHIKHREGRLIVISGPSGSGKTTICNRLLKLLPNLEYSISYTTRAPRKGERDGKDYFFISKEEFQRRIKEGSFLEYAKVFDNFYGTGKDFVLEKLRQGKDVLLCIDVQGASQIKRNFPKAILIFLMPPSLKVLEERLKKRATDHPEEISKRLAKAKEEMKEAFNYEYIVINNKIQETLLDMQGIIQNEK